MSLVTLKRKTEAKYNASHSQGSRDGFSLNGTTRYPSYVGKSYKVSHKTRTNCCDGSVTTTNYPSVKNTSSVLNIRKRWVMTDYTETEWNTAITQAGLDLNNYPYPSNHAIKKVKNNWVQANETDGTATSYIHSKGQKVIQNVEECQTNLIPHVRICNTPITLTDTGIIQYKCPPITKDIGYNHDKSSITALDSVKHKRGLLHPYGYEKHFPSSKSIPSYRACHVNYDDVLDAVVNGYFNENGANPAIKPCSVI